ncbi:tRNA pseudouridine(38-40) synthase TruA [Anaerocolumna sp. AGMB13020]|uniref:tRNA pseudouridine(38-40) synthase TruA n=1 Tax=Anaerocolumna sp. AGMB13020 TaxID=3081750 RepID=UPI0029534DFB|nr:tRNA pseudouridine(38-40) synthase TruA [Anaerocolumna sp. AGMB13020]WOO34770.1 tRNA pseudouridine(38-40) synthase TruA [Anaerocolumna sp. AGMB13020]
MGNRNIKMIIAYDGSRYAGWQRLKEEGGKRSVQAVIEEAISFVFNEQIKIIGSGRTDKGVHALGQAANFFCKCQAEVKDMKSNLQKVLPEDIAILSLEEASEDFHSRKSAISKTYEYRFEASEIPSVFLRKQVYALQKELDINEMERAAAFLIGTHDFRGFSSEKREEFDTIRRIDRISVIEAVSKQHQREIKEIRLLITGSGFLYNMVRIIAGTLLEVGEHKRAAEDVKDILASRKRDTAGITLPPEGLYLKEVVYRNGT